MAFEWGKAPKHQLFETSSAGNISSESGSSADHPISQEYSSNINLNPNTDFNSNRRPDWKSQSLYHSQTYDGLKLA